MACTFRSTPKKKAALLCAAFSVELRGNLLPPEKGSKSNRKIQEEIARHGGATIRPRDLAVVACGKGGHPTQKSPSKSELESHPESHAGDISKVARADREGLEELDPARYHVRAGFADAMDGVALLEEYEQGDELDPAASHYAAGAFFARFCRVAIGGGWA